MKFYIKKAIGVVLALSMSFGYTNAFGKGNKLYRSVGQVPSPESRTAYFGIGAGLDYGGLGFRGEFLPSPYLGIFAGAGLNFHNIGVNGGLSFKPLPFKRVTPTLQAMYGYNAVIKVQNASQYDKTYYGLSLGLGLDWKVGRKLNKLFFGVYYPIRSNNFNEDLEELKANPMISLENEPLPVTFSLGFNFGMQRRSQRLR